MVNEITEKEFKKVISKGNVLMDCYAPWCGPCKMISPIIDELSKEVDDYKFYKINMDDADEIAESYDIMSIPTILIFKEGNLENKIVGFKSKEELKKLL